MKASRSIGVYQSRDILPEEEPCAILVEESAIRTIFPDKSEGKDLYSLYLLSICCSFFFVTSSKKTAILCSNLQVEKDTSRAFVILSRGEDGIFRKVDSIVICDGGELFTEIDLDEERGNRALPCSRDEKSEKEE